LVGGDGFGEYRHRFAVTPLHDAQLSADAAAFLVEFDAPIREEARCPACGQRRHRWTAGKTASPITRSAFIEPEGGSESFSVFSFA